MTTGPLLEPVLEPLYAAYEALKRARDEREPLDLDLPERKILLKADGTVDRVIMPERLEAHRLIEEFMILANVAAAETLEKARVPLIYRVHDEPTHGEDRRAARIPRKRSTSHLPKAGALRPEAFNRILARVKGRDAEQLVNEVVLRSQAQAEYAAENYGHFGLNLRRYAHFTSPIRRYADLIVHRGLIRALKLGDGALPESADRKQLAEIAAQISATERRAMKAERETNDRLIAHFLADRIGASLRGPHLRRHPRRPVRQARRHRRRRLRAGAHHRRRIFPLRRGAPCHGRPPQRRNLPARRSGHRQAGRGGAGCRRAALRARSRKAGTSRAAASVRIESRRDRRAEIPRQESNGRHDDARRPRSSAKSGPSA